MQVIHSLTMTVQLADHTLTLKAEDHLPFQWMLQTLIEERPTFAWFKVQLNDDPVYVFTRHQKYLAKRWPCLFIMGKGWRKPITLCNKQDWQEGYQQLRELELAKAVN